MDHVFTFRRSGGEYRRSSDSSAPWFTEKDPTGTPGAYDINKFVHERELIAEREKSAKLLAALVAIAAIKPVLMHDSDQQEVLTYSPSHNPAEIARVAIAAVKGGA